MSYAISLTVNGERRDLALDDPRVTLLDLLRERLGLTGAKKGCDRGQCGACTVIVDGKATRSCVTSLKAVTGKHVTTIEGLGAGPDSSGRLHPLQQSFVDHGAFQCGYCTAGMTMGVAGILKKNPHVSGAEIISQLQKHLCRCGSYAKYEKGIHRAVAQNGKAHA